ncbi:AI-2E family transporter [Marivita hallyeonensis]|uniref:Predicted PurR-regulated permease PerM n=1 Tax=Marivita hallyeonensis TaxID=996342 RepID=A0A1M5R1U0_9RHOB|nr:AI-2E family transporter [Marivita hallyeonensis]SHH19743.1 Predicted PurR-regulated permease PerM [Marivita hallyeonensis]
MADAIPHYATLRTFALCALASVVVIGALFLTKSIMAPLVLAFVFAVVLAPIHDRLCRMRIGSGLAAALVLLALLVIGAISAFLAEPIVIRILDEIPNIQREVRLLIFEIRAEFRDLEELNQNVQSMMGTDDDGDSSSASPMPSLFDAVFFAPLILGQALMFFAALFFALTERRAIYRSAARAFRKASLKSRLARAERAVARYFGTVALINIGLGICVAIGLSALGLPMAYAWGAAAAVMNFLLYVGPAIMVGALLLAGILNFDGLMVIAPAAVYLAINAMEAQFVTPSVVGKHMDISPLLVFLSVVFWLYLWGPVGAIVAIPLLVFCAGYLSQEETEQSRLSAA